MRSCSASVLDGVPESIVVGGSSVAGGGVSIAMVAAAFLSNLPDPIAGSDGWSGVKARHGLLAACSGCGRGSSPSAAASAARFLGARRRLAARLAFVLSFAAGATPTMLADTMMPEAFEEGGKLVGLFTVLGFALAVWLSFQE